MGWAKAIDRYKDAYLFSINYFHCGFTRRYSNLSAKQKLLGQVCAALLVTIYGKIYITSLGGFIGIYDIPLYVSILLSTFIIISITNAFNLIDGIDGLSGGFSIVSFLFLGYGLFERKIYLFSFYLFVYERLWGL